MELNEYFQQLYDYHYWANHRILAACEKLAEEQLHSKLGQSWENVQGTLLHLINAEQLWLDRWRGKSTKPFYTVEDFPTFPALCDFWAKLETEMRAFVAAQTPATIQREVTYTSTLGKTYTLVLWQMMAQIPNHGTQHRTEIAAMLTRMDILHPENDIVYYIMETTGQREPSVQPSQ